MTAISAKYFTVAEPVPKAEFLRVYDHAMQCVQLLTAPFGLSYQYARILGDEPAIKEATSLYKLWEEALSRVVYPQQGMPYDRMAATMHKLVEEDHDNDVSK